MAAPGLVAPVSVPNLLCGQVHSCFRGLCALRALTFNGRLKLQKGWPVCSRRLTARIRLTVAGLFHNSPGNLTCFTGNGHRHVFVSHEERAPLLRGGRRKRFCGVRRRGARGARGQGLPSLSAAKEAKSALVRQVSVTTGSAQRLGNPTDS